MIGVDIVKIERIEKAIKNERFLNRVFTVAEREYAFSKNNPHQTLAGIYAAKEAVAKCVRTGLNFSLLCMQVEHLDGAPIMNYNGQKIYISISHDGEYAVATASFSPLKKSIDFCGERITEDMVALSKRNADTHKGSYGKIKIIGGSKFMVGAPYLAALAASKSGAGLTTLCVPEFLLPDYRQRVVEQTLFAISSQNEQIIFNEKNVLDAINGADCVAIGMGMGREDVQTLQNIIDCILFNFSGAVIIDGDGLFALNKQSLLNTKAKVLLTPHRVEFERLIGRKTNDAVQDTLDFASQYNCVVAHKSHFTVISDGVNVKINTTGSPALAKGGSGDVLAGMAAAFSVSFGMFDGAIKACYYLGKAGELLDKEMGDNSVLASDIINNLHRVFVYGE